MNSAHNPKLRFGMSLAEATSLARFNPSLADAPPLPAIDFGLVGKSAPTLLDTPATGLPRASAVVISWTEAEWAALNHVFCGGAAPLPYAARTHGSWPGWLTWATDIPADPPAGWTNWGSYRLVQVGAAPVLLFKSNTHLDFPGESYLEQMIQMIIAEVGPQVILSAGTAGGANPADHIGTVRAVGAGAVYEPGQPQSAWPVYGNAWKPTGGVLGDPAFGRLLNPVPTTAAALATLVSEFNQYYRLSYALADLDPDGLNMADPAPVVVDQTGGVASLLTTPTFVVATTAGNLADFSSVEMDDAIIGKTCGATTAFAFVRNISDPAQPAALPSKAQGNWGSAIYDVFGFYTSFNGALTAWAMLS